MSKLPKIAKLALKLIILKIMSQPFSQSVTFKLDKAHFQECFDQSALPVNSKDFIKAGILGVAGLGLLFVEAEHYYFPLFLLALAALEIFSVKYRKTWWVWRQLMSKAAYGSVTITVDDKGVTTKSEEVNTQLDWRDVNAIVPTKKGLLLKHQAGVNYLSSKHLGVDVVTFILSQRKS